MNPLVYWILFGILVALLVVFLSYIIFNAILDNCLTQPQDASQLKDDKDETEEAYRLNKYQFDRYDVEDLTRLQGDFKTVLPNVRFTNEVDGGNLGRLLKTEENAITHDAVGSSLSNIEEEDGSGDISREFGGNHTASARADFKQKKEISQSVDDLEFCDPKGIDVLKTINKIEEKARQVEKEIDYFVGGTNNLKFYEINEQLLRLMISLCDVMCDSAELQLRKTEILEYIEDCKRRLKQKAISV